MNIEKEIQDINERNRRVEEDKRWEISWTRRLFLMVMTYISALLFLQATGFEKPFLAAWIPALGYIISTFSLPFLRTWWKGA